MNMDNVTVRMEAIVMNLFLTRDLNVSLKKYLEDLNMQPIPPLVYITGNMSVINVDDALVHGIH